MSDPAAQAAMAAAIAKEVYAFNAELWTLYTFGVLVTILRTYARLKFVGIRDLRADDFIIWVAILLYTTQSTLAYFAVNYGHSYANNGMTPAARAALSPESTEYHLRIFGSKLQVVGWTSYVCLIATLKTALLVFYIRLMEGLSNRFVIRIWIGFGLVGATFTASIITIFSACRPFSNYWQINPDPGNACQGAVSMPIVWVTFASSVVTDLYLIMIPLPSMPISRDPVHGAQLAGEWGTREAFVSVVTTNLPMIYPLLKTWLAPIFGSTIYSRSASSKHPSGFQTIGGGDGNTSEGGRGRRQLTGSKSQATSNASFGGSEERIIGDVKMQNLTFTAEPTASANPPPKGIMVSSEFQIVDDKISNDDRNIGHPHESWLQ
ncbi:hypothetical protein LAWI1_G002373 [Lachnellula willkommii]|uniref:Rhodopsin domain-containing protein n=1 Tax=Lachnellula willkommii TaxID=215461 RepID=A0A559MJV7_9HELO|nr:hypothetical protein LAWI1_G002373 [Lachnellula willkommii]